MSDTMEQGFPVALGHVGIRRRWRGAAVLVVLLGTACSLDGVLNDDQLPPDVSDPAITQTPTGARQAYQATLALFNSAFAGGATGSNLSFVSATGVLSDELTSPSSTDAIASMDRRAMASDEGQRLYSQLQEVRGQAGLAIGLLTQYVPEEPALAGRLYALEGYTEIFLAELFCSGVPLSTVDYDGNITYQPGSTTDQILAHAIALFDTAAILSADSARLVDLAHIGRARALLGTGDTGYTAAAAAVESVADDYQYHALYNAIPLGDSSSVSAQNFAFPNGTWIFSVSDREGGNGLDYRTSNDPRTRTTLISSGRYHPDKYNTNGSTPVVIASGVEARLIEAEAALHAGDVATWLAKLNALRTDGTYDTTATSPPDTLWHAGAGGVGGLAPLADPGTPNGRIDLLFRERAFWLFLTGQRQGDLRRLIRQYGRVQDAIYPVGPYQGATSYGTDVTVPVPSKELPNPLFTGCFSRGA